AAAVGDDQGVARQGAGDGVAGEAGGQLYRPGVDARGADRVGHLRGQQVDVAGRVPRGAEGDGALGCAVVPGQLRLQGGGPRAARVTLLRRLDDRLDVDRVRVVDQGRLTLEGGGGVQGGGQPQAEVQRHAHPHVAGLRRDAGRAEVERRALGSVAGALLGLLDPGELADLVDPVLHEPEVAVGATDDVRGAAIGGQARVLGDGAVRGDSPQLVPAVLHEPDVAVRPQRDPLRAAAGGGDADLGEEAAGRDPADLGA